MKDLHPCNWGQEEIQDALKMKGPILIIGASGFIGAKLFFELSKIRRDVFAASRQVESSWRLQKAPLPPEGLEGLLQHLINLDVTNKFQLSQKLAKLRPQTVFNLSSYGAYESQDQAHLIHETNYLGTLNLIKVLEEFGVDAFVYSGSSSEYGINCAAPDELSELIPNSDYAVSKVSVSYLLKYYGKFKQFPCANLRLYSIYGPWEDKGRLIPNLVAHGLEGKLPRFVDKNISRDFVYIDDCLHALVKATQTVCRHRPGLSLNIATGKKTSLFDVATLAREFFSIKEEAQFGTMNNRRWDLSDWYGNPSLASKELGWIAKTTLNEGIKLTSEWQAKSSQLIQSSVYTQSQKKISAIIACYKDNQAIPLMYERLTNVFEKLGFNYEIIFVNDCSPTEDEKVISKICQNDHHVLGISHSRNFGSQSAFRSGMELATGDAVVLMDGDLQDPPEVIPAFVEEWIKGEEVVYGVRVKRQAPFYMQIFYKLFYRVFSRLSDIKMPVDAGDFSLIDRKVFTHLLALPEKDIFLRGLRAWLGFKQKGIPYVRPERAFGVTTNNFMKNIWWAKKGIFSFSLKPLNYIQRLALVIFLFTILLSLFYLFYNFYYPERGAKGITTIILLVLSLGGIQLFAMSVIGDYIGKILEEVKDRPHFIRSKILKGNIVYESEKDMFSFIERRKI